MVTDLSKLTQAIDAVTDNVSGVDVAALEKQFSSLTPREREGLGKELTKAGKAKLALNGKTFTLQIKNRTERSD